MAEKNKKNRIGLPRALHFHKYRIFWEDFLNRMGFEVIVSPETNQQILKRGANLAVDERCLSLKIYLGHIEWLAGKVDYIFLPRIVSLYRGENACTKFMALNDIVRNTFPNVKLLEYTIDVGKFNLEFLTAFWAICI